MDNKSGFFARLKKGLAKTRGGMLSAIFSGDKVNTEFFEELEEALILADVGMDTTMRLTEALKVELDERKIKERTEAKQVLIGMLADMMRPDDELVRSEKTVLLIVGVNGVGKTTSCGKLADYYAENGKRVMLAAADTFRAAAAEQLSVWAERANVPIIKQVEGADPAAVVFDALASFKAKKLDMLVCDTAGRLHNKKNLMSELEKIRRVIDREAPEAQVEALLTLDATTGQNAIAQAKVFMENTGLTGIILTKLDGTAKGGVAVAVKQELGLPVRFVGVGEAMEDLQPFDANEYAAALLE